MLHQSPPASSLRVPAKKPKALSSLEGFNGWTGGRVVSVVPVSSAWPGPHAGWLHSPEEPAAPKPSDAYEPGVWRFNGFRRAPKEPVSARLRVGRLGPKAAKLPELPSFKERAHVARATKGRGNNNNNSTNNGSSNNNNNNNNINGSSNSTTTNSINGSALAPAAAAAEPNASAHGSQADGGSLGEAAQPPEENGSASGSAFGTGTLATPTPVGSGPNLVPLKRTSSLGAGSARSGSHVSMFSSGYGSEGLETDGDEDNSSSNLGSDSDHEAEVVTKKVSEASAAAAATSSSNRKASWRRPTERRTAQNLQDILMNPNPENRVYNRRGSDFLSRHEASILPLMRREPVPVMMTAAKVKRLVRLNVACKAKRALVESLRDKFNTWKALWEKRRRFLSLPEEDRLVIMDIFERNDTGGQGLLTGSEARACLHELGLVGATELERREEAQLCRLIAGEADPLAVAAVAAAVEASAGPAESDDEDADMVPMSTAKRARLSAMLMGMRLDEEESGHAILYDVTLWLVPRIRRIFEDIIFEEVQMRLVTLLPGDDPGKPMPIGLGAQMAKDFGIPSQLFRPMAEAVIQEFLKDESWVFGVRSNYDLTESCSVDLGSMSAKSVPFATFLLQSIRSGVVVEQVNYSSGYHQAPPLISPTTSGLMLSGLANSTSSSLPGATAVSSNTNSNNNNNNISSNNNIYTSTGGGGGGSSNANPTSNVGGPGLVLDASLAARAICDSREKIALMRHKRQRQIQALNGLGDRDFRNAQPQLLRFYDRFLSYCSGEQRALSIWQVRGLLKELGVAPLNHRLRRSFDRDLGAMGETHPYVSFSNLVRFAMNQREVQKREHSELLERCFRLFARERAGSLSQAEASQALSYFNLVPRTREAQDVVRWLYAEADPDGTGRIKRSRFRALWVRVQEELQVLHYEEGLEVAISRGISEAECRELWQGFQEEDTDEFALARSLDLQLAEHSSYLPDASSASAGASGASASGAASASASGAASAAAVAAASKASASASASSAMLVVPSGEGEEVTEWSSSGPGHNTWGGSAMPGGGDRSGGSSPSKSLPGSSGSTHFATFLRLWVKKEQPQNEDVGRRHLVRSWTEWDLRRSLMFTGLSKDYVQALESMEDLVVALALQIGMGPDLSAAHHTPSTEDILIMISERLQAKSPLALMRACLAQQEGSNSEVHQLNRDRISYNFASHFGM